jgi:hypothetical protein
MSGQKLRYLICASHSLAAATWGHFPWKLVLRQISMLVIFETSNHSKSVHFCGLIILTTQMIQMGGKLNLG